MPGPDLKPGHFVLGEGECSHHCAIPTPLKINKILKKTTFWRKG